MAVRREQKWLLRDKYGGKEKPVLKKDLERLDKGEPLAYVIGWAPFLNVKIDLRYKPLIPRPETEFWTEEVIKHIGRKKIRIMDMFCGSGCIGITVLKNCPNVHVTLADLDPDAIRQTKFNLKLNNIGASRYKVVRSDVWKSIKGEFDLVLANPPYIPSKRKNKLSRSVTAFEPHTALFGGKDGMALIEKFLKGIHGHMRPKTAIFMEFDAPAAKEVKKIAKKKGLACTVHKDQFDRNRFAEIVIPKYPGNPRPR
jgi:release factor glutamine methyltransferase